MNQARRLALIPLLAALLLTTGCSLFTIKQDKRSFREQRNLPQRPELPFENKEQLARASALNVDKAAKVYYKGTEAESDDAEIIWKLSLKFASTLGLNTDFDPTNPESIQKVFDGANEALRKEREQNAKLREDVAKANEEKAKIIRDKAAEIANHEAEWKLRLGNLWWWVVFLAIALGALCFFFPAIGYPLVRMIFGGIKTAAHETFSALQSARARAKREIAEMEAKKVGNNMKSEEIAELNARLDEKKRALAVLDNELHKAQSKKSKDFIQKLKSKGQLGRLDDE